MTNTQQQALCTWFSQQNPQPPQKACIAWYKAQYSHELSQSTVSDSLSDRYKYLDTSEPPPSTRNRTGAWEDLEIILYDWQKIIESQGGFTSGDLLIEKACDIWRSLPQYKDLPEPQFSAGWLHRFKKRYGIKQYNHHGESASVPQQAEEEMAAIRTLSGQYDEGDIYNMDETGLFWRLSPSKGLSTQNRPGVRKDKSRVSLVCCVNASGTDRLPIWFIGKYQRPRALQNINIHAMGGRWCWNKKAWMDTIIMKEWLSAFYSHIGPRTVLLTMNNYPAHLSGLELASPPPNIRIQWLPANSTSRFQPLDQGIIQNLKVYYKKQWLHYMLHAYENHINPMNTVTVLDAIRWIIRAWNHDVLSTTINSCFRKSTLILEPVQLPIESLDLTSLFHRTQHAGGIEDAMNLSSFLNPAEESVIESQEDDLNQDNLLQQLILARTQSPIEAEEDEESEASPPIPKTSEALQAVKLLISFAEGQEDLKTSTLRLLEQYERELARKQSSLAVQDTLDRWISH